MPEMFYCTQVTELVVKDSKAPTENLDNCFQGIKVVSDSADMPLINTAAVQAKADLVFQCVALLNSDLVIDLNSKEHVGKISLPTIVIMRIHCLSFLLGCGLIILTQ